MVDKSSSVTSLFSDDMSENHILRSPVKELDSSHYPKAMWRRNSGSVEKCIPADAKNESKVLVLYTGGTIGMMRNEKGSLVPMPNMLEKNIRRAIHMHDDKYAVKRFGQNAHKAPLCLPNVGAENRRILYTIYEYEPLLDSSNMTMDDWIIIAKDIRKSYEHFDGFVVLHGTDTLAYTASALSYMLENLGKTVIITGSQIPIFETRSDGRENFLLALIIAGSYNIPEVGVCFNNKLFRGNRTTKVNTASLAAFDSPNLRPLVNAGINVQVDYRSVFRPLSIAKFRVHSTLNRNVGLLRLFPSITIQTVRAFLQPPMQGVILQTYGAGNVPSNRQDLIDELRTATQAGVLIVNTTQCSHGSVSAIYETGTALLEAGVIPGFDMTPEAALTKLSYVLSKNEWDLETKRQMMMTNLRGELTLQNRVHLHDLDLIEAVARTLHMSSNEEMDQLRNVLFPAMLCAASKQGDVKKLESLKNYGADLSAPDYDLRTALHVACAEGNIEVVEYLLKNGASVHLRDRNNNTPLMDAIENDFHEVINLLVQCGAHLTDCSASLGEVLCAAAGRGDVRRLTSYYLAGSDLSFSDSSGRTALHAAVENDRFTVIEYLVNKNVDLGAEDAYGRTAMDCAKLLGQMDVYHLLDKHVQSSSVKESNGRIDPRFMRTLEYVLRTPELPDM